MTDSDLKTLLDMYNTQVSANNALWTFFSVVALGVLGFVYKGGIEPTSRAARLTMSLGFLVFAVGHQTVILRAQRLLVATVGFLQSRAAEVPGGYRPILQAMEATPVWKMQFFHSLLIVGVLAAIWIPTILRRQARHG